MKYCILVENQLILAKHIRRGTVPQDEKSITKTKFNKIGNDESKIYKWISNDVVVEDNPDYIEVVRAEKEAQAKAECKATIDAGFEFEGDVYQSEEKDQLNYNSLVSKKSKLPNSFRMTLKNGNFKVVQTSKLDALTDAAFTHKMNALEACKDKIELIRQATTITELDQI